MQGPFNFDPPYLFSLATFWLIFLLKYKKFPNQVSLNCSPFSAVRRAKFVTKPLPHEINALMDCGTGSPDLSRRHDLLPPAHSGSPATGAAAAGPLVTYTAAVTSPQLSAGIKGGAGGATMVAPGGGGGGGATLSDNSFMAAGVCGMGAGGAPPTTSSSSGAATAPVSSAAATLSALLSANSSATVDIMEDEDEQERERLRYVPHAKKTL